MAISSIDAGSTTARSYALAELGRDSDAATLAEARELLIEYGRFVEAQPAVASFCFGTLETEAARLPESYREQGGGALLARVAGVPVGFVAWRALPHLDSAWELKRLWIRPAARGSGLGRALVQAVEERARAAGKQRLVLDTAPEAMPAAYRLYLEMGFTLCPPYRGRPIEGIVYLSKLL
jgi:GNAT superfamily N-acetyltransferase